MLLFPELHPEEMLAGYVGRMVRLNGISRRRLWLELHDQVGVHDCPARTQSISPITPQLSGGTHAYKG